MIENFERDYPGVVKAIRQETSKQYEKKIKDIIKELDNIEVCKECLFDEKLPIKNRLTESQVYAFDKVDKVAMNGHIESYGHTKIKLADLLPRKFLKELQNLLKDDEEMKE